MATPTPLQFAGPAQVLPVPTRQPSQPIDPLATPVVQAVDTTARAGVATLIQVVGNNVKNLNQQIAQNAAALQQAMQQIVSTQSEVLPTVTAQMLIPAFSAVTVDGYVADSNNGAHYGHVLGIAPFTIQPGAVGVVRTDGYIVSSQWLWSPLQAVYISSTTLSVISPISGWSQQVATAVNDTTILVNLGIPVLL